MVDQLKKGDLTIDFKALRLASIKQPSNPTVSISDCRKGMVKAFNDKNYEKAAEYAGMILDENFAYIEAHLAAAAAYKQMKEPEKEKFHRDIADGLIKSIQDSGDGKSRKTAYVVVSVTEEYTLLKVLGLKPKKQSLTGEDGHKYDMLEVVDKKTAEPSVVYFNIDTFFGTQF